MKHAYFLHTGYGKTKLCLDKIMAANPKPRTLLISTKNVIESAWADEITKWYDGQLTYSFITGAIKPNKRKAVLDNPTDIFGINTSLLNWYIKETCPVKKKTLTKQGYKYTYDTDLLLDRFDLLIIDEVSLFKNYGSARFKLIKKWAHKMKNVIILSATPTPRDIEDIWSQIYILDGGQRLETSVSKFRDIYAIKSALPSGIMQYEYTQAATNEVLRLIKDITTSVPKPDVPLFPEPSVVKVMIKPDEATAKLLENLKKDFIVDLTDGTPILAFNTAQLIGKVNQIASGIVYDNGETTHLNNIKMEILKRKLAVINTPVLVTYNFVTDKEKLLELDGARMLSKAEDFRDWNDNKIPIGILSPYSAAHGLNLQASDCVHIIWFSPIWDTEKWIQTNARICRRGQKNKVSIEVLLLKGSYDAYAFTICQNKFKAQYNNLNMLK